MKAAERFTVGFINTLVSVTLLSTFLLHFAFVLLRMFYNWVQLPWSTVYIFWEHSTKRGTMKVPAIQIYISAVHTKTGKPSGMHNKFLNNE